MLKKGGGWVCRGMETVKVLLNEYTYLFVMTNK